MLFLFLSPTILFINIFLLLFLRILPILSVALRLVCFLRENSKWRKKKKIGIKAGLDWVWEQETRRTKRTMAAGSLSGRQFGRRPEKFSHIGPLFLSFYWKYSTVGRFLVLASKKPKHAQKNFCPSSAELCSLIIKSKVRTQGRARRLCRCSSIIIQMQRHFPQLS